MVNDLVQYNFDFAGKKLAMVGRTNVVHDSAIIQMVFGVQMFNIDSFPMHAALLRYVESRRVTDCTPLVVDAGANIGAASKYFKEVFGDAKIVAIEPDAQNASLARANLISTDAAIVEGALSSEDGVLYINDVEYEPIAYRVGKTGNKAVDAVSMETILSKYNENYFPLIAKIDIEGGEMDVFEKNTGWIDRFPLIIIELHDWMLPGQGCSKKFFASISKYDFDVIVKGENTFCFNNRILKQFM